MFLTPGIEVSASAIVDETADITHQVGLDGCTEIQFGGHTGFYLMLSEQALRNLHEASTAAINTIDGTDSGQQRAHDSADDSAGSGIDSGIDSGGDGSDGCADNHAAA